jgi:hypothetical protein
MLPSTAADVVPPAAEEGPRSCAVSDDRFIICIEAADGKFHREKTVTSSRPRAVPTWTVEEEPEPVKEEPAAH